MINEVLAKMKKKIFLVITTILFLLSSNRAYSKEGLNLLPKNPDAYENFNYAETDVEQRLLRLAENGDSKAQFRLGFMYEQGLGVSKNPYEAIKWYHRAADQGETNAQFNLGLIFYKGEITAQNYSEAAAWFAKAFENGDTKAQLCLGLMYCNGTGVTKNYYEAAASFRKAATKGNSDAQLCLGIMNYRGYGMQKNLTKAAEWYRKAAEQGNRNAQFCLGMMYNNGEGVTKNLKTAYVWVSLSAVHSIDSLQNKAISVRNRIAKKLSHSQLKKSQEIIEKWTPDHLRINKPASVNHLCNTHYI